MDRMSGEDAHAGESSGDLPLASLGQSLAQFELGAEDNHNWEGRSDERIQLAVMTALHWDLAVPRDRVRVSVDRGRVTLTGRVTREYEKARAEADALAVPGVNGVTNRLTFQSGIGASAIR